MIMTQILKDIQLEYILIKELISIITEILASVLIDGKINWSAETIERIEKEYTTSEKTILVKKVLNNVKNEESKDILNRLFEIINNETKNDEIIFEKDLMSLLQRFATNYMNINSKNKFYFFIGSLCMEMQKNIFKKNIFDDDSSLRVHCRIVKYCEDQIKYKKLFSITVTKEKGKNKLQPNENLDLADINYEGSMIEKSFTTSKSMLYSLNPSSNSHMSSRDWIDFLTIVPKNEKNICKIDSETLVPYLSFGISVNNVKLQVYLRELGFIGIEGPLTELLNSFFECIPFDISTLLEEEA